MKRSCRRCLPFFAAAVSTFGIAAITRAASPLSVQLDLTRTYQRMEGFGASLTDSSASLLSASLNTTQRQALMQTLFDPSAGIGLSFMRQPIGASDFSRTAYTFDDVASGQTDFTLSHFSIAHDQSQIIPLLQQAKALNPSLQVMGTPWTPPAWMKQSSSVQSQNEQLFGGRLKDSDAVYSAYADYLVKFTQAYQAAGVPVSYMSLQNEPQYETTGYPSMQMYPSEQARLVKLLGPKLAAAGINTKLLAFDHNWGQALAYAQQVFNDPQAAQYFDGVAFHGYGGDVSAQNDVHNAYPNKGTFFTELSGGLSSIPNFAGDLMWDMQNLIVGGTRNWAKSLVRWNLALNATGGPELPGGAPNCRGLVTINQTTGAVTFNEDYYSLAHISKFVRPGAYRVDSDADHSVAFVNPDGSTAVVAYNDATSSQAVTTKWKGRSFTYTLPAQSVATFAWSDAAGANVQVWLTTGDKTKLLARQTDAHFVGGAWSLNDAGGWFGNANWSAGAPNGIDAEANLTSAISTPHTVYANSPITVGTLRFNNANTYVIGGTSSLTLQASSGSALVDVQAGTHKINLPLSIASNTTLNVVGGARLLISDPTTINAGVTVTQTGSGIVKYESTVTVLDGASIAMAPRTNSTFHADSITVGDGAQLQLNDNDLVLEDADFQSVRSTFTAGQISVSPQYDGHATTLAIFDNGLVDDAYWPADAIVGVYALLGDANLDGYVGAADLSIVSAHLGSHPARGAAWLAGDLNADGVVSSADADIVRAGLGNAVPEPASLSIIALPALALAARRQRDRRRQPCQRRR